MGPAGNPGGAPTGAAADRINAIQERIQDEGRDQFIRYGSAEVDGAAGLGANAARRGGPLDFLSNFGLDLKSLFKLPGL